VTGWLVWLRGGCLSLRAESAVEKGLCGMTARCCNRHRRQTKPPDATRLSMELAGCEEGKQQNDESNNNDSLGGKSQSQTTFSICSHGRGNKNILDFGPLPGRSLQELTKTSGRQLAAGKLLAFQT